MLAQYIILALVFNKGKPHRSPLFTNYALLGVLLAQVRRGGQPGRGSRGSALAAPCWG